MRSQRAGAVVLGIQPTQKVSREGQEKIMKEYYDSLSLLNFFDPPLSLLRKERVSLSNKGRKAERERERETDSNQVWGMVRKA